MKHGLKWIAVAYAILVAVLLTMCACMGCATVNRQTGTQAPAVHGDPSTWRPYQEYRADACELCGGHDVNWAHELPQNDYPVLKNDPDNGHTLCHTCHWFFHYQNPGLYWCDDMDNVIDMMIKAKRKYGNKNDETK